MITDPELYFTAGKQPFKALYIWDDGGLGIWGAVVAFLILGRNVQPTSQPTATAGAGERPDLDGEATGSEDEQSVTR